MSLVWQETMAREILNIPHHKGDLLLINLVCIHYGVEGLIKVYAQTIGDVMGNLTTLCS